MEPVTAMILAFVMFVGMGEEVQKRDAALDAKIEALNNDFLKLAGSHASVSARDATVDHRHSEQIKQLQDDAEFLEKKIKIYHD